jgi:hypothetical protein
MLSRAAALVLILAFGGASAAPCAGWETNAQARRDCCVDGKCPDEVSNATAHSGSHPGTMTQAEADRCCASAEQKHQQSASQFVDSSFALSPPVELAVVESIAPLFPARIGPDLTPHPSPPTRLHVLFSVFLV